MIGRDWRSRWINRIDRHGWIASAAISRHGRVARRRIVGRHRRVRERTQHRRFGWSLLCHYDGTESSSGHANTGWSTPKSSLYEHQ